jgi:large subunit ribosomal protein L25
MADFTLSARTRETHGKGAARQLRREGLLPAVFYGPGSSSIMLSVDYPELRTIIKKAASEQIILELRITSDSGVAKKNVMLKELQIDPIKDTYLHADFYEISMDKEITVNIPVHLINTPIGVTQAGGILQHVRRELSISCLPDKLVDALELDVSGLDIGDSLHVSDIEVPAGITLLDEDHMTVAVVAAPTVMPKEGVEEGEEEGPEAEAEEPTADTESESD